MQRNIFLSSMQRNIFFGMQRNIRHERCRLSPWPDTYFTLCRISATMLQRVLRLLYCIHYPLSRPCQRVWFSSGEHFLHLNVKHPSMCVHQMDFKPFIIMCLLRVSHCCSNEMATVSLCTEWHSILYCDSKHILNCITLFSTKGG